MRFTVVAAVLILTALNARAQGSVDVWMPAAADGVDARELETVFGEVLGGPTGPAHVVGAAGIGARLAAVGVTVPRCLVGLEQPCPSPGEAAARALGATRVVWATARQGRRTDPFLIDVIVLDVATGQRRQIEVQSANIREAVFTAVSSVTSATASFSVTSDPEGATVLLDGRVLGVTPYDGEIPIGAYDLALVLDGYYDYGSPIELRTGDARAEEIAMQRRYSVLVVEVDAPGAQVRVGDTVHPVATPIQLLPGTHVLAIEAPGYVTDTRTIELGAMEERRYRVTLVESEETLATRKREAIRDQPLAVQLGFAGASMRSTLEGARVRYDDTKHEIACVSSADAQTCADRAPIGQLGVDVTALFTWRWLELQLGGVGIRATHARGDQVILRAEEARASTVEVRRGRELLLRLPAIGARWQIDQDWSVSGRTGIGVAMQRIEATALRDFEQTRIRRTDWLWTATVAGRYHIVADWYVFGEIETAAVLNHGGTRARLGGSAGVGRTLDDPTGLTRRERRRDTPPLPPSDTPAEL